MPHCCVMLFYRMPDNNYHASFYLTSTVKFIIKVNARHFHWHSCMDLLSKRLPMFHTIWLPGKKAKTLLIDPVLELHLIASHCLITARSSGYYSNHV